MNNILRKKIGLKPIVESWKRVQISFISNEVYVSERNVIEKVIIQNLVESHYTETDLSIQMNDEGQMITKEGKIKNLTSSVYETIKPNEIKVSITPNGIRISNHSNNLMLIDEYDLDFNNLSEAFKFIDQYLNDDRSYFIEKSKNFRSALKTSRIKFKSGDIFRIPIKKKKFIYGQIISPLRQTVKLKIPVIGDFKATDLNINVFDPNPFYFPIWVRFLNFKTDDPFLKIEELNKLTFSSSTIIGDYSLRHSNFKIIGAKEIDLNEVDLPMEVATKFYEKPLYHYFNWGAGIVTFHINDELESLISKNELKFKTKIDQLKLSLSQEIEYFVDSSIIDETNFSFLRLNYDLRNNKLRTTKLKLFKTLGLSQNLDYDEFARKFGFKTKLEIIELNK